MKRYTISETAVFNIRWLTQTAEEATVTGTPTITIKKYTPATDTWSTEINAVNMTLITGSSWFYEYDTSGETAGYDYKVLYSAVVDTLTVEATEDFRIIAPQATTANIEELRFGNQRIDFVIATGPDTGRNVVTGLVDTMTIYTKADEDSDWSNPTSTKVLYLWYDSNQKCIAVKETD